MLLGADATCTIADFMEMDLLPIKMGWFGIFFLSMRFILVTRYELDIQIIHISDLAYLISYR